MDLKYGKIRSWHVLKPGGQPGWHETLCGRHVAGEVVDVLPSGEKTCETCETLVVRRVDRPTLNTRGSAP